LAEQACELTGHKRPLFLGTLSAAYAEAGRFDEAVETARTGRSTGEGSRVRDAWRRGTKRMLGGAVRSRQPFHETPCADQLDP